MFFFISTFMPNLFKKSWTISFVYRVRILLGTYSTVNRLDSKTLLLFSLGTFDSFLAEIECSMHVVVLPKQPINQFCKADNRCYEFSVLIYTLWPTLFQRMFIHTGSPQITLIMGNRKYCSKWNCLNRGQFLY